MHGLSRIFNELVWLTQLGFSILMPPLLCLGLAWLAIDRLHAPLWIMIPAFILGFGGGAASFWSFYKYTQRKASRSAEKAPPAFNQHH